MKHKVCQCCELKEMKSVGQVGGYEQLVCGGCGYVRFIHDSEHVNHALYEADTDYNDDLNIANDFQDFIQWNHNKAQQFMQENILMLEPMC